MRFRNEGDPNLDPSTDEEEEDDALTSEEDADTLDENGNPEGTVYDADGVPSEDMAGNPFGTVYADDGTPTEDAEGNPFGTEYDEDGEIVAAAPQTPPSRLPAAMTTPVGLTTEQRAVLEERFTPDQIEGIEFVVTQRVNDAMASMSYASSTVEAALSEIAPAQKASLLPRMNALIASMTPEYRSRPDSGENALILVMDAERRETGETMYAIMQRYHTGAAPSAAPKPRAVVPVRPPAARPPNPGGGVRPVVRRRTDSASRDSAMLTSLYGVTARQLSEMDLE